MALSFGPARGYGGLGAMDWFFHIPRTGGNFTIRACINLRRDGEDVFAQHRHHAHARPHEVRPDQIRRAFCIVRPPLDWYQSFYRFRIVKHYVGANIKPGHPLDRFIWEGQYRNGGHILDFDYFVRAVQEEYPGYVTHLYGGYTCLVDAVLCTDKIGTELPALLERWGYDGPVWVPPTRKNNTRDDAGAWVAPKKFKRWILEDKPIDALPVELEPRTRALMEDKEYAIINWLRERRVM